MTRRQALSRMGKLAAAAAFAPSAGRLGSAAAREEARRPNIVFMVADDLGYGDLGCYGSTAIATPVLDGLAKQGVRLTQYYVAVPLCAPTRVSYLTGKYPQRTSLAWNPNWKNPEDGLSPDETTIAEVLRDAGYHTGLVGKWHLGYSAKFWPLRQGFQEYYGYISGNADHYAHTYREGSKWMFRNEERIDEEGYLTDLITREAIAYIDRHQADPFFLYVAYSAPHGPMQAPEEWVKHANGSVYGGMVECLDDAIGKILKKLDDSGLADNTLVVFMSDNGGVTSGDRGSNGPLSGGKGSLWEGGIRVPLIARWPQNLPAAKAIAEPVISTDLFATFAAAAGAKVPDGLAVDGKDVLPALRGGAKSPHEIMFWQFRQQTAARRGEFKLLRDAGKPDQPDRLFDVVKDPGEKNDLAAQHPEVVKELSAALDRWLAGLKNRA